MSTADVFKKKNYSITKVQIINTINKNNNNFKKTENANEYQYLFE